MPAEMQAKLLTVLEDKEIRRLGAEQTVKIDVRFLAATNRQPETLLQEQTLRNDLYYRLAMNRIDLPPLREHPGGYSCLDKRDHGRVQQTEPRQPSPCILSL